MQQQIILAKDEDKQNMFECADVLFKIVRAVEKG
jgi:hypothetical protein